jgi:hypothetical protein
MARAVIADMLTGPDKGHGAAATGVEDKYVHGFMTCLIFSACWYLKRKSANERK